MTRTVWRITTERFAETAFTGDGARLYGGRWNPKGWPVVYTAESRSLALLELMVQDDPLRARYAWIPAHLPLDLPMEQLDAAEMPTDWRTTAAKSVLQGLGQRWLEAGLSAVLVVHSAVVPGERNYLLNPLHPDFSQIAIGLPQVVETDGRLRRG